MNANKVPTINRSIVIKTPAWPVTNYEYLHLFSQKHRCQAGFRLKQPELARDTLKSMNKYEQCKISDPAHRVNLPLPSG